MDESPSNAAMPPAGSPGWARRLGWWGLLALLGLGALVARCDNLRVTFIEGRIYFVDGDCYARMTRAKMIVERPGAVIHHHDFENFPEGVRSHTTAPFDYAIVVLKWVLDGVAAVTGSRGQALWADQTLDMAGALISPICGALTCLYLAWWARREMGPRGGLWLVVPLFFALSPILVHGTRLGRPDHQAPVIGLLAVALTAELTLLRRERMGARETRWWFHTAGAAWGMSLWISLFEPLLLLLGAAMVVAAYEWRAARKVASGWRERWREGAVMGGIVALMLVLEGSPIPHLAPEVKEYFGRWSGTVGELRPLELRSMVVYQWLGFGFLASFALLEEAARRRDGRAWFVLALLLAMSWATWDHLRWGYFLGLAYAISLPWQIAVFRRTWLVWVLVVASAYPIAQAWDHTLFPDEEERAQQLETRKERMLLRQMASLLREEDGVAPFLAPWWLSPALSYWSGQPGVAGSSHEGMPGIVDTARFFLAEDPAAAKAVLEKRRIAFVLVDEPSRTVDTALPLLAVPMPAKPLGRLIYEAPHSTPGFLRLRFQNEYYKLFAVDTTRG